MKCLYQLVVTSVLLLLLDGAQAHKKQITKIQGLATKQALSIRGGDLGPVNSETLANTFSFLASCDAVAGILAPISSLKWCGVDIEKGSLSEHFVHGIGVSASTMAVSSFLATSGKTSIKQAIGYGLAVRLASVTIMLLTNKYGELGMNKSMFGALWVLLAVTTYALFTDQWEPLALAKALSLLLSFHGIFLYAKPNKFLSRAVGVDKNAPLTKDLASVDGGYMMISGLVTGLLASGMEPTKVAGFASLGYIPVLVKLMDVVQFDKLFGFINVEACLTIFTVLLALIGAGTVGSTATE